MKPVLLVATAPIAAVAAVEPTVWSVLGNRFEAGSMICALFACVCVRAWTALSARPHVWTVEIPISSITLLFTAGVIVSFTPNLLTSIAVGTGCGAMGVKLIKRSLRWADKFLPDQPNDDRTS